MKFYNKQVDYKIAALVCLMLLKVFYNDWVLFKEQSLIDSWQNGFGDGILVAGFLLSGLFFQSTPNEFRLKKLFYVSAFLFFTITFTLKMMNKY